MKKIGLRYSLDPTNDLPLPYDVAAASIRITGEIYDSQGNRPLSGVTVTMLDAVGNRVSQPFKLPGSTYDAWTDQNPAGIFLLFEREGFADLLAPFTTLQNNSTVGMNPKPAGNLGLMLAAGGALLLLAKKKKRGGRRVGKITTADAIPVLLIGGGLLGFSTIKKFLEGIGFWNSAETKALNAAAEDPGSFWSPLFWRSKPASVPFTYTINQVTAEKYSEEIYDSFGFFNDNEEGVIAVFKRLRTKANASYLADVFQAKYGDDLLKFLRGEHGPRID